MTPASAEDVQAIERLHVRAWPALETADIGGWLWRYSGGGSQRANSVSTVRFSGDVEGAIAESEARYRARGAPVRFHTYDLTEPAGLADLLRQRGYGAGETTLTMTRQIGSEPPSADVTVMETPDAEWREVYVGTLSEHRRAVNARILDRIPAPRAFFAMRRDGRTAFTGLCVADGTRAVVECMATRDDARRQGGARAILAAIAHWAAARGVRTLALQAVDSNLAAVKLYGGCGFTPVATNRFWIKE